MTGQDEVSTGELSRGLARLEREMQAGFAQLRGQLGELNYVQPAVYAADQAATRDRLERLEAAAEVAQQRAWQSRWSINLALFGMPLSIVGAVVAALVVAALR